MQRARNWLRKTLIRRSKIPPLPDDILLIIFEYLTTEERLPLCAVCKKFRLLELQIGHRQFDSVFCLMLDDNETLNTSTSDVMVAQMNSDYQYSFTTKENGDFETSTSKFFNGAKANYLNFHVATKREPKPSLAIRSIIDLIAYKEIFFYLDCKSDFTGLIISFFENFKNANLRGVTFIWQSLKYQNIERLQEAMQHLPKLKHVSVKEDTRSTTIKNDDPECFLVDGPLMLTIIQISPDIQLDSIKCTTQDLLNAFQMVCEAAVHKDLFLFAVRTATDDLITVAEEQGFLIVGVCVMDYTQGYTMFVLNDSNNDSARYNQVAIRRIDGEGNIIRDNDSDSDS